MNAFLNRREFLTASGAGLLILRNSESARGYQANERLNLGLVGCGGRGTWFVETLPRMENVVALCDVDAEKMVEAMQRWNHGARKYAESPNDWERRAAESYRRLTEQPPQQYQDFRVMLDRLGNGLDAVVIATPDHTHAVAAAAAIRAGKHVFVEKPLTRTVHESRALRELAREHRVATSMGNQGTATGPFRRALELIRNGTIGEIREVHIWNTGGGADRQQPPAGQVPVPESLAWDLWLGPAADRPYHPDWMRRNQWRDFGTCQLGNWGSHTANLAFMALKVYELWLNPAEGEARRPLRISARTSGVNRLSFPRWEVVRWEIPARAEFPPIVFHWHNGPAPQTQETIGALITDSGIPGDPEAAEALKFAGAAIVGAKGTIHSTGHNATFRLIPAAQFPDVDRSRPQQVENSRGHEQDWLLACRGGKPAWANFDYASALNEFLMLGNVATQSEETLDFDPVATRITNSPAADALLRSEYRNGWEL
ncbi:MAG: Gfo/Idh/MocA family oxidoreductase [Pirellulaceae bacterium]|nr:Gfo/Idh/MocA family oxidoreductase [Pirellulaceae bacterium]